MNWRDCSFGNSENKNFMKRNISEYAGYFLLIGAVLIYLYAYPLINEIIVGRAFLDHDFGNGGDHLSFYVNNGYFWFIPIMVVLGIFYLLMKNRSSIQTGALIHLFFAVLICLYALMMIFIPNDEIYELIIISNSWFLLIGGVVALFVGALRGEDKTGGPGLATTSLLLGLPGLIFIVGNFDLGSEGLLLGIGQMVLPLLLVLPFWLIMRMIWRKFV